LTLGKVPIIFARFSYRFGAGNTQPLTGFICYKQEQRTFMPLRVHSAQLTAGVVSAFDKITSLPQEIPRGSESEFIPVVEGPHLPRGALIVTVRFS